MPLLSVGTAGFSLMALELVVIFAYQAMVGYLYYRLAILIAALMLGMAVAVVFGMFLLPKENEKRSLVVSHYLISWFSVIFLASLPFVSKWGSVVHAELVLAAFAVAAGFFGGWTDRLVSRLADTIMAFPLFVLAMGIVAALGNTVTNIVIATAIINFPLYVRVARAEANVRREAGFVQAARLSGNGQYRILLGHIHMLPNTRSSPGNYGRHGADSGG